MKNRFCFLLLMLGGFPLLAYDWPAVDVQVAKTFGQRVVGQVLPGLEIVTSDSSLLASDRGDLLFLFRPNGQTIQNLPSGLGGFVVLAHEDSLRTVITRIDPEPPKRQFQRGEPVGKAQADVGLSESRHRLFVFDQQLGEIVNPFLIFPPVPDGRGPVFLDVQVIEEGQTAGLSLFGQSTLAVGYWQVTIQITDPSPLVTGFSKERTSETQRGIYAIEAYLNGSELFNVSLDSLQEKSGFWQVKGINSAFDKVLLTDKEWNLGQVFFNEGNNILEIVVKDFAGNGTGKTFRVRGTRTN